ncbi:MAG: MFS transporter [Lachnospiraceae bacterium]|nr:MFS transporter [Lachnospiraceae bacterium]
MFLTVLLIIIYLAFISLGLPDSLLGSAWPSVYQEMHVPISYGGIISMLISGGTIVSSLFSSKIIKKLGTGWTTGISVLMTAVALLGFSVSKEYWMLCLLAIPLGLGAGSVDAALNNFVALHYKARHMSWLHCFWGIGATTGPVILSFCLKDGGNWQSGYRVISLIQFCLVVCLFCSISLWKKVEGTEGKKEQVEESETGKNQTEEKVNPGISGMLKLKGAKQALVGFFCYCALEASAGLWGSSYLVMEKGVSPEQAAKWIALFYFGITFGRFLSGFLTIKLSNRQMVRLGQGVAGIGIVFLLLPFGLAVQLLGLFFVGLGCAPIYPSMLHATPDNFGSKYSQGIMGIQMASAYVGTTFMPPLLGFLAKHVSYKLFPFYLGLILLVMIGAVEGMNRKVEKKHG